MTTHDIAKTADLGAARAVAALASGLMFGFGLALSGMVDPARVVGFLDVASGRWDPSLAFVLAGAVLAAIPGVILARRLRRPAFDAAFALPTARRIDRRLIAGSALFGIGWGLAGFCPGPAVASLSLGIPTVYLFVAAMAVGMLAHDHWVIRRGG